MYDGKILLITGGTGSFGSTVLQRLIDKGWSEIRIFSRDEKKQEDLRLKHNRDHLKFIIGDVRDSQSVASAVRGVDYIFHAAALKQVPSCEFYPLEAVKTNVVGTGNVVRAAIEFGVQKCVVLSTDKAVHPVNAMGMSKALMEKVMVAESRHGAPSGTVLCGTRYGNVMGSRGSVIPLFLKKLSDREPLTITDPLMTRFLMSLHDSVDLVLYAFDHGAPGDIFVQKSPAASVNDLAQALMQLMSVEVGVEIIGTRHGEKKHESLVSREEMARSVDCGNYYQIKADNRDLNYSKYTDMGDPTVTTLEDYTSANTKQLSISEVVELIKSTDYLMDLVEEFRHRISK